MSVKITLCVDWEEEGRTKKISAELDFLNSLELGKIVNAMRKQISDIKIAHTITPGRGGDL
jgi:hypothetical protein